MHIIFTTLKMTRIHTFIVIILLYGYTSSELYTSIVDIEELLQTEAVLMLTLRHYIFAQEQKLMSLKKYLEIYKDQHEKASKNIQLYVAHPVNAYLLIKRLTTDWKHVENIIDTNLGQDFAANLSQYHNSIKFPSEEDLNGAAVALTRLQDTYRLDTSSLASGELNGVKYNAELSAADCFELGKQSYINEDFYYAQLWMIEADQRLGKETYETVSRSDILEYLAFSLYKLGHTDSALNFTNELLELIPTHEKALGNKLYYEDEISRRDPVEQNLGDHESEKVIELYPDVTYDTVYNTDSLIEDDSQLYKKLCRNEITTPEEVLAKLKCKYVDNGNPFLKIAPFKVEEAYTYPDIIIFHDIMSDNEISTLKLLARPRFKRAYIENSQTGESEIANYRISKSAWLNNKDHKCVADIVQRLEDMTGLTMTTAESLQVANYGIGGHYEPHFDFATKDDKNAFKDLQTRNRIATVLFYMSDVAQGGATVFPKIRTALWPKKGTAAFWYNLHSSGEGDVNTLHGACPVLAGSKWVSNKWIHEAGQEFLRPCDLTRPPSELTI